MSDEKEISDLGDVLDGVTTSENTQAKPQETKPEPITETETPTDDAGQVLAPDVAEPPKADAVEEPEAGKVEDTKPTDWTYAAYADEKSKRQAYEKKIESLEAQQKAWEYQRQQDAQKQVEVPDIFDDSDAYTKYVQEQALAPIAPVIQGLQEQIATQAHGAEAMQKSNDWFNTLSPQQQHDLNARYGQTADPYGGLIAEYKKSTLLSEIGNDADAYKEKIKAELLAEIQGGQTVPVQPNSQQATPEFAPSIAGKRSVGARGGPKWAGPTPLGNIFPD